MDMVDPRSLTPVPSRDPLSDQVLREKFLLRGEATMDDVFCRVAQCLAVDSAQQRRFLDAMRSGLTPAGRIASAAGSGRTAATMVSCFVQPIADCLYGADRGMPGIMQSLSEAAQTMRQGGGVGYDFSAIRPKGALVKGTESRAAGPLQYMKMFDQMGASIESAGGRKGAQMAVMRIDHPDIEDFINAKRLEASTFGLDPEGRTQLDELFQRNPAIAQALRPALTGLTNFNLSVAVTDEFMRAVQANADFELVHAAKPHPGAVAHRCNDGQLRYGYRTVKAAGLWSLLLQCAYESSDPGVLFIDTINSRNNLRYWESLAATNPCGEQPLPAYGGCVLSPVNLTLLVKRPFEREAEFDWAGLRRLVAVGVEFLDRVIDVTAWPLGRQAAEAKSTRRIGLGHFGLGNVLAMLGLKYGSPAAKVFAARLGAEFRDAAYLSSVELAKKLGPFELFAAESYLEEGTFASTLPPHIQEAIRQHGIRNSHLLSIAPTGTTAIAFGDNASSGIEPPFSLRQLRTVVGADGTKSSHAVEDYSLRLAKTIGRAEMASEISVAHELSAADHLGMVEALAPYVDGAISKTVNVPADASFDEFCGIYYQAWLAGVKGLTTFRPAVGVGAVIQCLETSAGEPSGAEVRCVRCEDFGTQR